MDGGDERGDDEQRSSKSTETHTSATEVATAGHLDQTLGDRSLGGNESAITVAVPSSSSSSPSPSSSSSPPSSRGVGGDRERATESGVALTGAAVGEGIARAGGRPAQRHDAVDQILKAILVVLGVLIALLLMRKLGRGVIPKDGFDL